MFVLCRLKFFFYIVGYYLYYCYAYKVTTTTKINFKYDSKNYKTDYSF